MKELTIEQKAQRYDEAIEIAKRINNEQQAQPFNIMTRVFPELKESEDEKWIPKEIAKYLKEKGGFRSCWLAWLEKQGEQKPVISDDALREGIAHFGITQYQIDNWLKKYVDIEKQGEQKPADNVEPKFKIGDWVIDKQGIVHQIANVIENVTNHTYSYDIVGGSYFNDNTEGVRLWTIRDAKDGTVLIASDGSIFLFKDRVYSACKYYIALTTDGAVKFNNDGLEHYWETVTAVHPATKEQRDALMKAMYEAGYAFDFEKKKLKKIVVPKFKIGDTMRTLQEASNGITSGLPVIVSIDNEYYHCNNELIAIKNQDNYEYPPMNRRQNPAWSEEDKNLLKISVENLTELKDRFGKNYGRVGDCINWLKSIKDRSTWKPSDEQMRALEHFVRSIGESGYASPYDNDTKLLYSLLFDLKKLRGE